MHVTSIVGARPQFVKLAAISRAFDEASVDHTIIHTGQHYDPSLSDVFFEDLKIPAPDIQLGIGSATQGIQTGKILEALEPILSDLTTDWVLVYGDTNSTLAAAVCSVKLHIPTAHLEAGLRSFNRLMPEEHNRVLTDHAADLLLAPTRTAMGHLSREGLGDRSHLVGDVMTDICLAIRDVVMADPQKFQSLPLAQPDENYLLATIHRAENTDDSHRLASIITALQGLSQPVYLPVHPRLENRARQLNIDLQKGSLVPVAPLAYPQLINAVLGSQGVITDSGGLQKEAYLLQRPTTTLRSETEWVETLDDGWNVLAADLENLDQLSQRPAPSVQGANTFGDGRAANYVASLLKEFTP